MASATIVTPNGFLSDRLVGCLLDEYELQCLDSCQSLTAQTDLLLIDYCCLSEPSLEKADAKAILAEFEKKGIPVILFWQNEDEDHRELAISMGCADYLAPPFYSSVVNAKCMTYVSLAKLQQRYGGEVSAGDLIGEQLVEATELLAVQDAAILCLATIARIRDHSTGNHILRTQHYVKALAEHLRKNPEYQDQLDHETIELFYKTSALHDIGKVGIPDHILQKPGSLSDAEYEVMKTHTTLGYQAVYSAEQLLERNGSSKAARFLTIAKQVTLSHHERWDGNGYPQGLKGEAIPLVARLMAVADVYDAMISRRPYKNAIDHQYVTEMILASSGSQFDPAVVDAYLDLQDMFERISYKLEDVFPSNADMTLHSMADLMSENDKASD